VSDRCLCYHYHSHSMRWSSTRSRSHSRLMVPRSSSTPTCASLISSSWMVKTTTSPLRPSLDSSSVRRRASFFFFFFFFLFLSGVDNLSSPLSAKKNEATRKQTEMMGRERERMVLDYAELGNGVVSLPVPFFIFPCNFFTLGLFHVVSSRGTWAEEERSEQRYRQVQAVHQDP